MLETSVDVRSSITGRSLKKNAKTCSPSFLAQQPRKAQVRRAKIALLPRCRDGDEGDSHKTLAISSDSGEVEETVLVVWGTDTL